MLAKKKPASVQFTQFFYNFSGIFISLRIVLQGLLHDFSLQAVIEQQHNRQLFLLEATICSTSMTCASAMRSTADHSMSV